jgi:raffinose/stachyose/melibiose transport system permease protein
MLAGLMLPAEAFIIPLYFNLRGAGLNDTFAALVLPQTAQSLAFGIFWLRNQFRTFPTEIIEAARLDGARDLRVLWQVIVPASIAPIMTMCVLITMWTWNEFLLPLVLITSEDRRTAPLGLAFFKSAHLTDYSALSAAGVIVALPIVVLYVFLQRRFISGMLNGIADR